MQINRSDEQHYDARKQSLIQQILSYKKRIQEYEGLQKQLKTISTVIDKQQLYANDLSQTNSLNKAQSRKSLSSAEKKMNEQASTQLKRERTQRRMSSSKKIKIYELQKKLYRLNKDHNQKFSQFISEKRQHQVTQQIIMELTELINKQRQLHTELEAQDQKLANEQVVKRTEFVKAKKELQQVMQKKQSYQFQKKTFLDKISSQQRNVALLKNQISMVSSQIIFEQHNNNTNERNANQFGHQMQNTLSNRQTRRSANKKSHKLDNQNEDQQNIPDSDLSYSEITCNYNHHGVSPRKIVIQGVQYNVIDSNNSFQSLEINPSQTYLESRFKPLANKTINAKSFNKETSTKKSTQITDVIETLEQNKSKLNQKTIRTNHGESSTFSILKDKLEILQGLNCQMNNHILTIKKEMISIQTQIKHHKTSLQLLKQKIKVKNQFIDRQKIKHLKNLQKIQLIRRQLSQKQGQRGQMRGRIGTRVDQQGIVKLINVTLEKDLQNLKEKVDCLVVFRNMLCGQIIQQK